MCRSLLRPAAAVPNPGVVALPYVAGPTEEYNLSTRHIKSHRREGTWARRLRRCHSRPEGAIPYPCICDTAGRIVSAEKHDVAARCVVYHGRAKPRARRFTRLHHAPNTV